MPKRIRIKAGSVEMEAELNDSKTAQLVWDALPIRGRGNRWGDEIYFSIPVKAKLEEGATDVVEKGTLGYCLLYTSPSPRDLSTSRMPSSA